LKRLNNRKRNQMGGWGGFGLVLPGSHWGPKKKKNRGGTGSEGDLIFLTEKGRKEKRKRDSALSWKIAGAN